MWKLLQIEIFKIFKKPRTYIAFAAITVIILLVQLALRVEGREYVGLMMSGMNSSFDVPTGQILNGYMVCFIILNLLLVHVPILVALIAGDVVAGEANMGTLRLLVTKPVSRTQLLLVKFLATAAYTFLLMMWVAVLALVVSIALFGTNDLFIAREFEVNIIASSDVLWRYAYAFAFALLAMLVVAALAFMFSCFAENSIGPIVATVCVIIVFTILTQMQVPFYEETLKPYLFITHMIGWKGFFYVQGEEGVTVSGSIENASQIIRSAVILIGYVLLFLSVGFWHFNKKNILS